MSRCGRDELRRRDCEIGKRGNRRARTAAMIDERTEGAWTDIVAADEAEPIKPWLVGQPDVLAI